MRFLFIYSYIEKDILLISRNLKLENVRISKNNNFIVSGEQSKVSDECFSSCPSKRDFVNQKYPFYFESEKEEVFVGTDPLSLTPLYYLELNGLIAVSDSPKLLLSTFKLDHELSEQSLAAWLAGQPIPSICIYKKLTTLPAGHAVVCRPTGLSIIKYWDISSDMDLQLNSDAEYADYFKALLRSVVEDTIGDCQVVGSQMSGGMDSTSITALANAFQTTQNKKCIAISHYYKHDPHSDESKLIADMREFIKLSAFRSQEVDDLRYRNFLELYPAHFDHPGIVLSPRYRDELADLKSLGITKLLTGNGGDEMCWGHASAFTQRLFTGEWGVVPEVFRACKDTNIPFVKVAKQLFIKPLIPESIIRLARYLKGQSAGVISLPPWMTNRSKLLATEAFDLSNPFSLTKEPTHHARYFALKTSTTFNSVRSYSEIAREFGITMKHPFFDYRIAEFSFSVPPKQLIRGAYPKFVLRNAMTHDLPPSICWRKTKTTFDHHFGNLVRENAEQLRECISHPYLADRGLLNTRAVLDAFDTAIYDKKAGIQVDLLFVILTQRWIQTFHS